MPILPQENTDRSKKTQETLRLRRAYLQTHNAVRGVLRAATGFTSRRRKEVGTRIRLQEPGRPLPCLLFSYGLADS